MQFYVTHEKNGIYQGLLMDASSTEQAEAYFREKKPENQFVAIHEARREDYKPGTPLTVVPDGYGLKLSFDEFKAAVRAKGGIWAGDDVRFTQFRDGYAASFRPEGSVHSERDCAIVYNWEKDVWRYEDPKSYDEKYNSVASLIASATAKADKAQQSGREFEIEI